MATQTSSVSRKLTPAEATALAERTRYRIIGGLLVLLGIAGYFFFANGIDPTILSTFGLTTGGAAVLPDWVVPSYWTSTFISAVVLALGGYQLARGFGKWTNTVFGVAILFFIFAFLTWATSGKTINLAGLLRNTLQGAIPLTLGALSGILSERAGVVNIAIEGLMLAGALVAALVGSLARLSLPPETYGELSLWIGLFAGVAISVLLALAHAVLSIHYKVDQIISGVVINIFSTGITSFISAKFMQEFQELNSPGTFSTISIPLLADIPVVGSILFRGNIFVFGMYLLLIAVHVGLFYTRWGLRTRAVGEHPKAADTLGINVFRTRYMAVLLSGAVAGFGGAYLTLGSVGRFDEVMTAGKGFISLAAMIFGNWSPFGAFGASLIFGFADALQGRLAILKVAIPSEFLLMAPYIATMIALAGLVGKATPPAADGQPYEKQ